MPTRKRVRQDVIKHILGILDWLDGQGIVFTGEELVMKTINEMSTEELQTISR